MIETVEIAGRPVGAEQPTFVVAEIGINHNGDLELARRLIAAAAGAGCDAVKFQKRTSTSSTARRSWLGRARSRSATPTAT